MTQPLSKKFDLIASYFCFFCLHPLKSLTRHFLKRWYMYRILLQMTLKPLLNRHYMSHILNSLIVEQCAWPLYFASLESVLVQYYVHLCKISNNLDLCYKKYLSALHSISMWSKTLEMLNEAFHVFCLT